MSMTETAAVGTPEPGRTAFPPLLALYFCLAAAPAAAGGYLLESSVLDSGGGGALHGGQYFSRGSAGQRLPAAGAGNSAAGGYVSRAGFYNPPHFTFQKGLASEAVLGSGAAVLTLPPDSVGKEVFDITLNANPVEEPLTVDPGVIAAANGKMEANEGGWGRPLPGNITEVLIFDEMDAWDRPFARGGAVSLRYRDDDGDGVLDGSSPPLRANAVKVWALDTDLAMWAKLPSSAGQAPKSITVPLLAPGVFALLGTVDESVKDTYAFPVPFRPGGPAAGPGPGQTGTEAGGITFANIPQAGKIEVYTLDGRLVRRLPIPAGLTLPKLAWDVRTSGGDRVASGVYIWRVASGSNSKTGKLMVIW